MNIVLFEMQQKFLDNEFWIIYLNFWFWAKVHL